VRSFSAIAADLLLIDEIKNPKVAKAHGLTVLGVGLL
jgi:hypothetical protein